MIVIQAQTPPLTGMYQSHHDHWAIYSNQTANIQKGDSRMVDRHISASNRNQVFNLPRILTWYIDIQLLYILYTIYTIYIYIYILYILYIYYILYVHLYCILVVFVHHLTEQSKTRPKVWVWTLGVRSHRAAWRHGKTPSAVDGSLKSGGHQLRLAVYPIIFWRF